MADVLSMAPVVYITRSACTCVRCFVALPAGARACAIAAGMSCLSCARIDENAAGIVVMAWHARRGRFERRAIRRARAHAPARYEGRFVDAFATRIRAAFPGMPPRLEFAIAEHACGDSDRIGCTKLARSFHERAIRLAVIAHIRHCETPYDALLVKGARVGQVRKAIQPQIDAVLARWRA